LRAASNSLHIAILRCDFRDRLSDDGRRGDDSQCHRGVDFSAPAIFESKVKYTIGQHARFADWALLMLAARPSHADFCISLGASSRLGRLQPVKKPQSEVGHA
jgi:hypothetical protein